MEFCPDPDGGDKRWFRSTNETISLSGLSKIYETDFEKRGNCRLAYEYANPFADMLYRTLAVAPANAVAASFIRQTDICSRAFTETGIVSFYGQQ
jgi:hypothetical protein